MPSPGPTSPPPLAALPGRMDTVALYPEGPRAWHSCRGWRAGARGARQGGGLSTCIPHSHPSSAHLSCHPEQVPRALGLSFSICPTAGVLLVPLTPRAGPSSAEVGPRPLLPLADLLPQTGHGPPWASLLSSEVNRRPFLRERKEMRKCVGERRKMAWPP